MEQTIQQPLELPGHWTSRPASFEDIPELVAMVNERCQQLFGESEETAESWAAGWHSPGLDLEKDTRLLLDTHGTILADIELWDNIPPHVIKFIYWRVRQGYEDAAVGKWALQWAEQHARQRLELSPEGTRVVMSSRVPENDLFSVESFRERGFIPVRRMDCMRMPLAHPPAQAIDPQDIAQQGIAQQGIQIRAVQDEKDFDNFLFVLWEAFQDHWGHIPEPFEDFDRRASSYIRENPGMADSLCLLALEGGQPAGASLCRRDANGEADLGWINMLGVRRDWRKRGLGKALLLHSFALFKSIGMGQVGLDVDSESLTGALRLYESVGLRTVRSSVTYQKEIRPGKDLTVQNLHNTSSQD